MPALHIAVIRGGRSSGYDTSIETGGAVLKHLPEPFRAHDILIDRSGAWYRHGVPVEPARALRYMDVIVNALHGTHEHDGEVHRTLDTIGIPYTGSKAVPSALLLNRIRLRKVLSASGIRTPHFMVIEPGAGDAAAIGRKLFLGFPQPSVVKAASLGSSLKPTIARTAAELAHAVGEAFARGEAALIEEYIEGKKAACGVVEGLRGEPLYTLFPAEIIRPGDSASEAVPVVRYECPGRFSREEKEAMSRIAKEAHQALGLRHYSHAGFTVHPRRGVYLTGVSALPALAEPSSFVTSLEAGGISMPEFLRHIVGLAASGK